MKKLLNSLSISQTILLGFLSVILIGSILLWLPFSSQSGEFTNYIDALFTATSAVCVTGQVTLNTALHWNYFGKTVIIILIEIGGLGFISLIVSVLLLLDRKLNLRHHKIIQNALNLHSVHEAKYLIKYILKFAFGVQIVGSFILMTQFIPQFGLLKGIYFGFFHAISAFCNAGFDLFGDSLVQFQQNPIVLLTIGGLIIVGGLGFIVWRDIVTYRKNKKLLIQTRITLIMTAALLIGSFLLFTISEGNNGTFDHVDPQYRWMNYLFMAITPRTAGYANIDYQAISLFGVFLTIVLMFIGGATGSTAGGIKTSTLAVVIIYIRSIILQQKPIIFNRTIAKSTILNSLLIICFGIFITTIAGFLLLMTETIPEGFGIEYILVEVFSCFATVGLTMGLTPHLTIIGKLVLIVLMYVGRVGIFTFLLSFRNRKIESHIEYPEERIVVG